MVDQPSGTDKTGPSSYSRDELLHMKALGMTIGRLRAERTDLSRFQFSHKADIHRNSMNSLENGESAPGLHSLVRIAKALDIPLSELFIAYEAEYARLSQDR